MKILMVAPFSVYPKGTVQIRMLPIAKTLIKRGYEVQIIVPPYDNSSESGQRYELDGVDIINARFVDLPIVKYPITLFSLLKKILRTNPSVLYIFKPKGYSGLTATAFSIFQHLSLYQKTKVILDTDDWEGYGGFADFFKKNSNYPAAMLTFFHFQEILIPRHADAITVASKILRLKLISEGVSPKKIFYVPNGKPERSFEICKKETSALRKSLGLEGSPVILLYTRFFEYKIDKILSILSNVKQKIPSAKLLVIGRGEFGEEKKLKQLVIEEGFDDSVILCGWINFKDIPKYLAIGDVAIYPFDDTPLNKAKCPGKLIELMAAGRAIVANDIGQIKEYIENGKSGLLANVNDNKEFAKLVVEVLTDDSLRNKLEMNSQEKIVTMYNWSKLTSVVEEAIFTKKRRNILEKQEKARLKVERRDMHYVLEITGQSDD